MTDRWRITYESDEPTVFRDSEELTGTVSDLRYRMYKQVRRASYVAPQDGPNREVRCTVYFWDKKWVLVFQTVSRLRKGKLP